MDKLPGIFNPEAAINLPDEVIRCIAGETDESQVERASSMKKMKILEDTMAVLRRLERHNPKGE